jgi:SM-20-related protein
MTAKSIAKQLGETGLCVCPDFLSARTLNQVAGDFDRIHGAGEFRGAEVGRGPTISLDRPRVRTDATYWLNPAAQNPVQAMLWRKIHLLKTALNRSLFLGLNSFEGHYAVYARGGYYHRHRDCFRGGSERIVSFVLYLNRDWKPEDGGCLRMYTSDKDGLESHTDLNPIGGTLVCFMSADFEHEVLLNHRQRYSLTGWFKSQVSAISL